MQHKFLNRDLLILLLKITIIIKNGGLIMIVKTNVPNTEKVKISLEKIKQPQIAIYLKKTAKHTK